MSAMSDLNHAQAMDQLQARLQRAEGITAATSYHNDELQQAAAQALGDGLAHVAAHAA